MSTLKPLINFKKLHDVTKIQSTLFEIVMRDACANPEYYKECDLMCDLSALNRLLSRINAMDLKKLAHLAEIEELEHS